MLKLMLTRSFQKSGPSSSTITDKASTATTRASREHTMGPKAVTNNVTTRTTRALSGASAATKKEATNDLNVATTTVGTTLRGKRLGEGLGRSMNKAS
jgi:hypothetical protein